MMLVIIISDTIVVVNGKGAITMELSLEIFQTVANKGTVQALQKS